MNENSEIRPSRTRPYYVALAGNPNSGKTTLFNILTGSNYKVANYPGVTVEKREGRLIGETNLAVQLCDLPGIYSLSGLSEDERIAAQALFSHSAREVAPDAIIVVVDSTNLERNLFLVTQLLDGNIPLILALNMTDLAEAQGITIYKEILARELDIPVVAIVASRGDGVPLLKDTLIKTLQNPSTSSRVLRWLEPGSTFQRLAQGLGEQLKAATLAFAEAPTIFLGAGLISETIEADRPEIAEALLIARTRLREEGIDPFNFETTERYRWVNGVIKRSVVQSTTVNGSPSAKFDNIATHKAWGTALFVMMMAGVFQAIFLWAQLPMDLIDSGVTALGSIVGSHLNDGLLKSLIVDGIIAGVGSVVIFIPQIAILFLFLGILEDTGYLVRAAYLMDRLLRPFGLQGRSFIPLLSSFACAIPGILSTRSIPSWPDRMATIMIAPLMSCSARLPVYTVLIAAFIPNSLVFGFISLQGLVLLSMYLLGIIGACIMAWLLKHSFFRGVPAIFVMEMPPFRMPAPRVVVRQVYDSVVAFVKNAGTIILACSIVLWLLASFPRPPAEFSGSKVEYSLAGRIGKFIEPAIRPLGYNWEIGVGLIASFAAREVFITSLSTVYRLEETEDNTDSLIENLKQRKQRGAFPLSTALSLMVFYVFACQCMSTLAVVRRETGSWRWTAFMFTYMTALAYGAAFMTFRIVEAW